ncbi:hypothetical protein GGR52DRAFT_116085 [Hypoxylon sp. FL1284]|nr:hypothetical protein GGR52DRAFT_116085 [Hypoxylon sp. FL1284]
MRADEDNAYLPTVNDLQVLRRSWRESGNQIVATLQAELGKFERALQYTCAGRRPFLLDNGYCGITNEDVKPGDTVRIVPGARAFFTFRKVDQQSSGEDRQILIGETHVSGAMGGEASEYVKQLDREWENICVV